MMLVARETETGLLSNLIWREYGMPLSVGERG